MTLLVSRLYSVDDRMIGLAGETVVLEENTPQCHFSHQKSHTTWAGIESGPTRWEVGD
jgi:hypothetical protein